MTKIRIINNKFTGFCKISRANFALRAEKSDKLKTLVEDASKVSIQDISSATQTSEEELYRVLGEIARDRKCSEEDAFCALALLAQIGAVSPRAQDGVKVIINGTEFKIQLIRNIIKTTTKKTFRRLAKTYATEFHSIAKTFDYAGNLYNKISLKYPEEVHEDMDKHWFSDFQSENEDCPKSIRDLINRYYEENIKITNNKKK